MKRKIKKVDFVNEFIKAKYSNRVAKGTKTLKQIMNIIDRNKNIKNKEKVKETITKLWNIIYTNTKSKYVANQIITEIAFQQKILCEKINKNYKNTIKNDFHKYTKPFIQI